MGFFTKLIKTAVVTGAAVGGVMYCKNRKETRDTEEKVDLTGVKPFEFEQDEEKITVSVNKNKIKDYADQAADKAIDAADTAQEKITDKLGEEKVEDILREEIRKRIEYHFDNVLRQEAEQMMILI